MPSRSDPSTRSRRTIAPVAIKALPNDTSSRVDSRATRAATSSFITDARVSNSTSFSDHQDEGRNPAASRADRPARYPFDSGGRSYGGALSPPPTSTPPGDPPAPPQPAPQSPPPPPPPHQQTPGPAGPRRRAPGAAAPPPPISRKSTCRSATSGGARGLVRGREAGRDLVLEPGVEHEQDLVAGLDHRIGQRHEARAVAQDRDHQRALRHPDVLHHLPGRLRSRLHLDLDDLQPLLREIEQVQQPHARHLVLDQAQDQVGRRHRRLHPEQLE